MIVVFSASSPLVSVAVLTPDGDVVASDERMVARNASGACLEMLASLNPKEVTAYGADTGPGSFIGARVGVTLAKTLAFAAGLPCIGASSFDLISVDLPVAIPNRKGEWLLRVPRGTAERVAELPDNAIGYGEAFAEPSYPRGALFGVLLPKLEFVQPHALMPTYIVEPSISQPKTPFKPGAIA